MGKWSFLYKSKAGSDQEILDLSEEGRILAGINTREWEQRQPTKGEKEAKQQQPFETTYFELGKVKNIVA